MSTLGIEREWFITKNSIIVPLIDEVLPVLCRIAQEGKISEKLFGFELFAGQMEDRSRVVANCDDLLASLTENELVLTRAEEELGLKFICTDFVDAHELESLRANRFNSRHQNIWARLPQSRKIAASQVAATHIHVGVEIEVAVKILNYCRWSVIRELAALADFSNQRRLDAYQVMAETSGESPLFENSRQLLAYINQSGGERDVWDFVRYKPSTGTIEFRMFGATRNHQTIRKLVETVLNLVDRMR